MSKTLTFEISEDLYQSFDYIARRDGKTTEQVPWSILLVERPSDDQSSARKNAGQLTSAFAATSAR